MFKIGLLLFVGILNICVGLLVFSRNARKLLNVLFADVFPSGGVVKQRKAYLTLTGFVLLAVPLLFFKHFLFEGLRYHGWGKEVLLNGNAYVAYSLYLALAFLATLWP